jgi:succinate dehydrogenase / fumarate reductase iron-sulfur subunit
VTSVRRSASGADLVDNRRRLPQGQPERHDPVVSMVETHDELGFGGCTNTGECTVACPKGIPLDTIGRLNRDYLKATTGR